MRALDDAAIGVESDVMQRRDFVKITGAAALVPSVGLAGDERRVLLLPTPYLPNEIDSPHLRGRVVLRSWDFHRGYSTLWGSLVRRDSRLHLSSLDVEERVEWSFAETVWHEDIEWLWNFAYRGGGNCTREEWAIYVVDRLADLVQEHLEGAREIGLPSRYQLVVLAGSCRDEGLRDESYTYGASFAFVDGEVEWSGDSFSRVEDLAASLIGYSEQ